MVYHLIDLKCFLFEKVHCRMESLEKAQKQSGNYTAGWKAITIDTTLQATTSATATPVASGPVASGPFSSGPVACCPVACGPVASGRSLLVLLFLVRSLIVQSLLGNDCFTGGLRLYLKLSV